MLIPVRCFCNKVIGHLWKKYDNEVQLKISQGGDESIVRGKVMDDLGLSKYCCRRMFLGHVDVIDTLLKYSNNPGEKMPPKHSMEPLPENYLEPEPIIDEGDDYEEEAEMSDKEEEQEEEQEEVDADWEETVQDYEYITGVEED